MKTSTATKIYNVIEKKCEDIPMRHIDFSNYITIKQYFTKRAGALGYQMHTVIHDFRNTNTVMSHNVTGGTGFCKESSAYWKALRHIGLMTRHDKASSHEGSGVSHNYHVGGNYYRVPAKDILKLKNR